MTVKMSDGTLDSPGFRCTGGRSIARLRGSPAKTFVEKIGGPGMHHLIHWFSTSGTILAILVTAGVAVLLVCCLGCSNCPSREKDALFRRHEM
jgi:hypothetical protein